MGLREAIFGRRIVKESGQAYVQKGKSAGGFGLTSESENHDRSKTFQIYKEAYERVPLITAIIDVQADQTVQEFFFEGPNSKKIEEKSDKVNLIQFFHKTAKLMLLYGNSYVEVLDDELKILNPIWIDVYRKDTGDVIGYSQIIEGKKLVLWGTTGSKQEDAKFAKIIRKFDHIVHFKHNVLGSEKYGRSVIQSVIEAINVKLDMEGNLRKVIFKYVAPLIWAKVGSDSFPANTTIVNEISDTLTDLSAESEITTSHLVDLSVLDFKSKGIDLKTPLGHVENQIITGGQVPPVLLGRSEGVDKATAEVSLRSFGRHIKANQRELKNEFEDKILVGQGWGGEQDKLIWSQAEEREREIEVDMLRGLVTDGIITPQKANDLLPPRFRENLPEKVDLLNGNEMDGGVQNARPNQFKNDKVKGNPNDPTQTTKDLKSLGKRVVKTDREVPVK